MTQRPIGVLCVENNEEVCAVLQRMLDRPPFRWLGSVPRLDDLESALERASPDLVVISTSGDEADAVAWVRRAKASRPGLRAALLTTVASPDVLGEALLAGVDGLLSKFDSPSELARLLAAAAEGQFVVSPEARSLPR